MIPPLGERRHVTNSKILIIWNGLAEHGNPSYLCASLPMIHDWGSIITNSRVWKHHLIHQQEVSKLVQTSHLCKSISVPTQLRYMDPVKSNEIIYSGNMLNFPVSTKEKVVVQILMTKFHIVPVTDSRLEIRLNPIMRDLVINRPAAKKKRSKRQKKEPIAKRLKVLERINRSS